MTETFVIIHRSYDPIQADILGQILRENGIYARVLGTRHGAVIGVGQNILQVHIEVPRSQAGEATDFLEAFFQTDGAQLLQAPDDSPDEHDAEVEADAAPEHAEHAHDLYPREDESSPRPLFAAGLSLILGVIGAGHLYTRRPFTAVTLMLGHAVALRCMLQPEWSEVATGLVLFGALIACDLLGGVWSAYAHTRAARSGHGATAPRISPQTSIVRQLLTGALLLTLAGAFSALVGPRVPEPDTSDDRRPEWAVPAY